MVNIIELYNYLYYKTDYGQNYSLFHLVTPFWFLDENWKVSKSKVLDITPSLTVCSAHTSTIVKSKISLAGKK